MSYRWKVLMDPPEAKVNIDSCQIGHMSGNEYLVMTSKTRKFWEGLERPQGTPGAVNILHQGVFGPRSCQWPEAEPMGRGTYL